MKVIDTRCEVDVSADAAWAVFRDFGALLDYMGIDGSLSLEGKGRGTIRRMNIPDMGQFAERLDTRDDARRTLAYTLVEGNPLGMVKYRVEVSLTEVAADRSRFHWRGEFEGAPETDIREIAKALAASYQGMSEAIASFARNSSQQQDRNEHEQPH
jgi:hypothetical protein